MLCPRLGIPQKPLRIQPDLDMDLMEVQACVEDLPFMKLEHAREMRRFIIDNNYENILELGFYHGVSTAYMAAVADEVGAHVTTIDLVSAREREPNIDDLLSELGLREYVTVYYEPHSHTWRLMKMLEAEPRPEFDFCYIDAAHSWETDGFGFCLVDKLLNPGGMVVFDDLDWTYDTDPSLKDSEMVQEMAEEYRSTPQVRKIYDLLVKSDPKYGRFRIKDSRGFARKMSEEEAPPEVKTEKVLETQQVGFGAALLQIIRAVRYRLF